MRVVNDMEYLYILLHSSPLVRVSIRYSRDSSSSILLYSSDKSGKEYSRGSGSSILLYSRVGGYSIGYSRGSSSSIVLYSSGKIGIEYSKSYSSFIFLSSSL